MAMNPRERNLFEALQQTNELAHSVRARAESLVDRLCGPQHAEAKGGPQSPPPGGLLYRGLDQADGISAALGRINAVLIRLESSLPDEGTGAIAQIKDSLNYVSASRANRPMELRPSDLAGGHV
jgi:hypothetical protein